jgi:predicted amidohydrolase
MPRVSREPLVIAVAQPPCVARDVAANALAHAAAVRAAGARVVVFPELSLTGYELDAEPVDPADPRLAPLTEACAQTGTLALAGAVVAGPSIGVLAVDGNGARVAYRKMWLGGAEPEHFRAGEAPAVIEACGWRLGLAVCKDTGVEGHAAATAALGIGAYVAGALETAEDADVQPARARRIATAHGVPVAVASFAGATGGGFDRAAGGSAVWDRDGTLLAAAGTAPGELARAVLR